MLKDLDNAVFFSDDIAFVNTDSDVTFLKDDMGLVNVDRNNVSLDDDNFDDDSETIIHVKLMGCVIDRSDARHVRKR